ncbi:MAG: methylenetetrahydrofolate reductase [NAD(P)H] [Pirellulaceae bacterium]|jgi:methylenetetrahydrofolate reductase (NADPH)|nr:methylenetetrahydrofolate reductase [NAD(P)H] [Pirellulaceae bacterium]HJN11770.1 methylenetetrahydrofolate reductase [NAD(P)H] [Pirellulaceae bacterium]
MTLAAHYGPRKCGLSFELFPPKTEAGENALFRHVEQLMQFQPSFITCTYGAGGSTREKTMNIVAGVKHRFNIPVASHLTCVNASIDELRAFLEDAGRRQIDYIVALRGDPPQGETEFKSTAGGLQYANQLVELIHAEFSHFGVAVAGYPETHQEAVSADADLENLKCKVDAGADIVITQLFYNNEDFFRFRDRVQKVGISVPLVPGILPVTNLAQVQRITTMCGAQLPAGFVTALGQSEDSDSQFRVGVDFATQQIQDLMDQGVPGVHFYVLNKSQATSEILTALNLERQP